MCEVVYVDFINKKVVSKERHEKLTSLRTVAKESKETLVGRISDLIQKEDHKGVILIMVNKNDQPYKWLAKDVVLNTNLSDSIVVKSLEQLKYLLIKNEK